MVDKNPVNDAIDNVTERMVDVFIETRALYIDSLNAGERLHCALRRAEAILEQCGAGHPHTEHLLREIHAAGAGFCRL